MKTYRRCFCLLAMYLLVMQAIAGGSIGEMSLKKGYQTTGRSQQWAMLELLTLKNPTGQNTRLTRMHVSLKGQTAANISAMRVVHTTTPELYAADQPTLMGETTTFNNGLAVINLTKNPLTEGENYIWLMAVVKADATLGDIIDADIIQVDYICEGENGIRSFETKEPGGLKIFARQSIVYAPTSDSCRFYRIPAMILDRNGNIVVAADRRYDSDADLGQHKIDVSVRRSTDGGQTWSAQHIIAQGDGTTLSDFGYGDAALARTASGRLILVAAAGKQVYWQGIKWAIVSTSDDDGISWTQPRQLFASNFRDLANGKSNELGFYSIFATSGKGLTTSDGTVMFAANCLTEENKTSPQCYILATKDEGENWTLGPANAYAGCDESKLEQLNDGRLLLSVRQSGKRGFNVGSADAKEWGEQYTSTLLPGTSVNADILYYARQPFDGYDIMLHTYCKSKTRDHLTLSISLDEGKTWEDLMTIQEGSAAYSTMVKLPDGNVAILYEDGSYDAGNDYAINYIVIDKEQILSALRKKSY